MNYIREFLYRPKRSDKSNMARFFFADENLSCVAAELDSFDGRKDPERCACLVNRLRSCRDKLINICNRMLEELEPGAIKKSREFRAKYPDDIMNDNLAGQLWFGAECLAAGSSIMNKESESESMRPLAKAVTKSLEKVRALLREQCLTPQPEYTESIREHLKIFDRLFADFEFNYVRCMVHVKTTKEFELHQDLIVLFSETLMRAIKEEMINQDAVDYCDPSLMFAIPRLAIVYGLLICNREGPLNVDRSSSEFPTLFLPFKNLLRRVRELLYTLDTSEVRVLEMLLCNLEEPANIATKLKEVQRSFEEREKTLEEKVQALKLQEKLTQPDSKHNGKLDRLSSITCSSGVETPAEATAIVNEIVEALVKEAVDKADHKKQIEIDCTGPDIEVRVSPKGSSESSRNNLSAALPGNGLPYQIPGPSSSRSHASLKRHNARKDSRRTPFRYHKDRRAKFKSTEDLLRRLYVCISGAADQLQSNYAGDFRSILRTVFVLNTSPDEEPQQSEVDGAATGANADDDTKDDESPSTEQPEEGGAMGGAAAAAHSSGQASPPSVLPPHALEIDVATDAMQHDQISKMYDEQLRRPSERDEDGEGAASNQGTIYAQNLDLVSQQLSHESGEVSQEFYQPEPTLLDIAQGAAQEDLILNDTNPREIAAQESAFYNRRVIASPATTPERPSPPAWIPDEAVGGCMGCSDMFTLIRRRHHCRACGKVFCGRCSNHSIPLPQFRLDRPVRVCNRCHLMLRPHATRDSSTAPNDPTSPSQGSGDASYNFYQRNFGMVS